MKGITMDFFDILIKPRNTMPGMLKKVDVNTAHLINFINGVIVGLGAAIALLAIASFIAQSTGLDDNPLIQSLRGLGILVLVVLPIVNGIFSVVGASVYAWVYSSVAARLGGKGSFAENYFLLAQLSLRVILVFVLFVVLLFVPIINLLALLLMLPIALYFFYLNVLALSIANKVSMAKAGGMLILVAILYFILNQIFFAVLGVMVQAILG